MNQSSLGVKIQIYCLTSLLPEIFVIVQRFLQKVLVPKLNMVKRENLARHPRTIWQIWACVIMPTSRTGKRQQADWIPLKSHAVISEVQKNL